MIPMFARDAVQTSLGNTNSTDASSPTFSSTAITHLSVSNSTSTIVEESDSSDTSFHINGWQIAAIYLSTMLFSGSGFLILGPERHKRRRKRMEAMSNVLDRVIAHEIYYVIPEQNYKQNQLDSIRPKLNLASVYPQDLASFYLGNFTYCNLIDKSWKMRKLDSMGPLPRYDSLLCECRVCLLRCKTCQGTISVYDAVIAKV